MQVSVSFQLHVKSLNIVSYVGRYVSSVSLAVDVQLQLQKLRGDTSEMLSTVKSETERGRRLTGRLMKQAKTSDVQLAEARDKMTSLKHEAEATDSRLKSAL